MRRRRVYSAIALFGILFCTSQTEARTISRGYWQGLVYGADFIGVVRAKTDAYPKGDDGYGHHRLFFDCEVLDTVKGDPPSTVFTVFCGTDDPKFDFGDPKPVAGNDFALAISGQSNPFGDPVPAPAKYQLGRLCPMTRNPDQEYPAGFDIFYPTDDKPANFAAFREEAKVFLALPPEEQAFQCMKRSAVGYSSPKPDSTIYYPELAMAADATDTNSLVAILLTAARANKECAFTVCQILEGGRRECLDALNANKVEAERLLGRNLERARRFIEWRLKKAG